MNNNLAVWGLVVVIAIAGFLQYTKDPVVVNVSKDGVVTQQDLGSGSGQNQSSLQFLDGGLTYGSGCFSTSTTAVLNGKNLENGCIYIAATGAGQGALTLTLPASSTMSMIPTVGSCHEWFVDNSDVAAATTTTILLGTGHDLVGLDATGAGTGADVIDGLEFGRFTSCREKDGNVVTFVHEYIAAD